MHETDSDELQNRKFGRRGRRLSGEGHEPFAIRRPEEEQRESNVTGNRNRRSRDDRPVHWDAASLLASTSLETLGSAGVHREDRLNRSIASIGDRRVADDVGMRFIDTRKRPSREYSREKPNRCYRGCENRESGCRGNVNSRRPEITEPQRDQTPRRQ